jgi:acylglycerol lipase
MLKLKALRVLQGGALVLYYATNSPPLQHKPAGIIATSPLILQTVPASKVQRWAGGKLCLLTPNVTIPAPVKASVRPSVLILQGNGCV